MTKKKQNYKCKIYYLNLNAFLKNKTKNKKPKYLNTLFSY